MYHLQASQFLLDESSLTKIGLEKLNVMRRGHLVRAANHLEGDVMVMVSGEVVRSLLVKRW